MKVSVMSRINCRPILKSFQFGLCCRTPYLAIAKLGNRRLVQIENTIKISQTFNR